MLLGSNLDGWVLLSKENRAYYLNLVSRDRIDLPILNRNIRPLAQCGFLGALNKESSLVILELGFQEAMIVAHRRSTGWISFTVPAVVQTLLVESFRVTANKILWVASRRLFCCSHEQFQWRANANPQGGFWFCKSVIECRDDLYLLLVNEDMTNVQIFEVNADNGILTEKKDFTGLVYTTRGTGGVPSCISRVLGAGGLWDVVEGFELFVDGASRVLKQCYVVQQCSRGRRHLWMQLWVGCIPA